jgi:hypothetical protein
MVPHPDSKVNKFTLKKKKKKKKKKRYRYPNPKTGNQDIGCPGEVEYDLYSDWCKFCSMYKQGLSRFLFSLQVMILASIFISFQFGFISSVFMPVAQQLIVRSTS